VPQLSVATAVSFSYYHRTASPFVVYGIIAVGLLLGGLCASQIVTRAVPRILCVLVAIAVGLGLAWIVAIIAACTLFHDCL